MPYCVTIIISGDIIINLDEPNLSTPKQQIIDHEPKIGNNKFKFLPSNVSGPFFLDPSPPLHCQLSLTCDADPDYCE